MDLRKYLPTDEMIAEFEEYSKLTSEEEKTEFLERRNERIMRLTPEEQDSIKEKTLEGLCSISNRLENITEEVKLGKISKIISLSYVAKNYFGKSRQWLYQRLNGNSVNGKPARFTSAERQKLSEALSDIGRLVNETSLKIV